MYLDVSVEIDMGGVVVFVVLKSGEIWIFCYDFGVYLFVELLVYLEKG